MHFFRLCMRLLLLAWLAAASPWASAHLVTVVSSDKSAAFQEVTDSLTQELQRNGIARLDIQLLSLAEFLEPGSHSHDSKLCITLGTDAFRQVWTRGHRAPVLAALIPRISFERVLAESGRKGQGNAAALYLDQPFGRQLDLLRLALPSMRRIGVLWGPESLTQQALLTAALQGRALDLSEGVHSEGQPLISALRQALSDADVLLAVADGSVYNPTTVSNILLTSYRAKTPVLAFSPAYVKAGALLSVYTTGAQAGLRIAALTSSFLASGSLPPSQYPGDYSISVNAYVAHSLGLSLDADALLERLRKLEKVEKRP